MKHRDPKPIADEGFEARLRHAIGRRLDTALSERLRAHARELDRWGGVGALIGRGTRDSAVERHYAESLAGLELVPDAPRTLVDVGSGAGFPGFVLAAALPSARALLVEPRTKKVAFLEAAARRARLELDCLEARIELPLPQALPTEIDLLTLRALRLPVSVWAALASRLAGAGRILVWCGEESPEMPETLRVTGERRLQGSDVRRIVAYERTPEP